MKSPEAQETIDAQKQKRVEEAERIAFRYEVEADAELRPAYKANFQRIAASYRQLAEEVAK